MMALKNLFLKDYSGVDEDDYSVAVYTQHGVYESLFYVLDQASSTPYTLNTPLLPLLGKIRKVTIVMWCSCHMG